MMARIRFRCVGSNWTQEIRECARDIVTERRPTLAVVVPRPPRPSWSRSAEMSSMQTFDFCHSFGTPDHGTSN